ncbi:MAG: Unknown protein [uncultured Sulfurovum sp.]|uniref:Imelysin-like domain-containing protein n=1 Tax=uncultured Sulfurovum sp. TaxID=269237 RepID=A0A6S6S6F3_9BACT|nr:MAG: Unknown protein [uncultured Sulfurovum sp.]
MRKKITSKISLMVLISLILSFFTACGGGENAYDGENGLINTSTTADAFSSMQSNVFAKNANELTSNLSTMHSLIESFDSNLSSSEVESLQTAFVNVMTQWKSVQATYIAGDYNSSLIDTPQLIDFFNTGKNADIAADIDQALNSSSSVQASLLTNSSKSITALEYLVFGKQSSTAQLVTAMNTNGKRRIETIKVVVDNIQSKITAINDFYKHDTQFVSDETEALNTLVNALVDSAYKLKEQRIGEAAGLVVKYKDNPDATRLEYYKSKKSLEAMKAILTAHNEIMGEQSYENFGSFAADNGALTVVSNIRTNITTALGILEEFSTPIEDAISPTAVDSKIETLYNEMVKLQENYFTSLIASLSLTAEIIEADGD